MVDREARDKLALAIRRLATRRITFNQFLKQDSDWLKTDDDAIYEIYMEVDEIWESFSDVRFWLEPKVDMTPELRKFLTRTIVFLHSDLEYIEPSKEEIKANTPFSMEDAVFKGYIIYVIAIIPISIIFTAIAPMLWSLFALITFIMFCWRIAEENLNPQDQPLPYPLNIWPFVKSDEYDWSLKHPRYLAGKSLTTSP